jgi:sugar phosphate isomerase/epimerase
MKIGFRTCGFARWKIDAAFKELKAAGYDGVEICLETHGFLDGSRVDIEALRRAAASARESGLELASVSYHGDAENPRLRWRRAEAAIKAAGEVGAAILILNSPPFDPGRKERILKEHIGRLGRFCRIAEDAGVTIAVEPEPFLAVEGSEDMLRVLDGVRSRALAVNLDVGHAFITDRDVAAYIRLLAKKIVHTHFEDIKGRVHRHLVPGEGDMPLGEMFRALSDIRYAGYITVDLFNIHDAPGKFARAAMKGIVAAMRRG